MACRRSKAGAERSGRIFQAQSDPAVRLRLIVRTVWRESPDLSFRWHRMVALPAIIGGKRIAKYTTKI
jgi:hypothetical protein